MTSTTPDAFLVDEALAHVERLAAADLVMKMRRVDKLSQTTTVTAERRKFAEVFRRTGSEFLAAAARMEREVADLDTPAFICVGSDLPLTRTGERR